jgi:hypothetical protein
VNAPVNTATLSEMRAVQAAPREAALPAVQAGFFDLQGFELLQRVAKAFSSSSLVPAQYQNNVANCMIALNLARRLGADELMVMQNLYIVHGNPGWSAKFLIACVNTCGRYTALRYEWRGQPGTDDFGCRAWAIERETKQRLEGAWVDWRMVKAEGWNSKSGSKWKTMPEQMFIYRAAAFWQRAYAPEISMGLTTAEELADVVDVRADGSYTVTTESLRADMARVDAARPITGADPETGEVDAPAATPAPAPQQQRQPDAPAFDAEAFAERLEKCGDVDTLDLMADEIRTVPGDMADSLNGVYRRRREQLSAKAAPEHQAAPAQQQSRRRTPAQTSIE